ncbi:MAG: peroxidase-related enzyme, partial [Pseudomonadota bacterium]|nr:peroxidase-related enzyme [Pseudomonadota bacterium]
MPQPKHIVKIQLPNPEDLDAETIKYFQICEEKLGFVPNVLRAYTNNFEKLRAFTTFYNQLMLDEKVCTLSILEREMIAVVVSSANRCYYCL